MISRALVRSLGILALVSLAGPLPSLADVADSGDNASGGLGPLQSMGVAGSMDWKFEAADKGTRVELRYAVGGYSGAGGSFKEIAPGVDSVLKAQFERYKRYAETGKP